MSLARDICFIFLGSCCWEFFSWGAIHLLCWKVSYQVVGISVIRFVSCFSSVISFLDFALACPSPGDVAGRIKSSK
ncbi:hypothetical protein B9Z19DRAFT_1086281 [Tuber borchii]|uniref:Uncharacterized protein n=1 Tax=Tuber borchii TaxID=42251 RepID=A0A2T6ZPK6_TUBBO|nr:hypothetical protein B9Z19DRAFT_1086281 [Tuber borchii]